MMNKTGKESIPCTYCEADALPDTNPPVCAEHVHLTKTATNEPTTLKELDSDVKENNNGPNH